MNLYGGFKNNISFNTYYEQILKQATLNLVIKVVKIKQSIKMDFCSKHFQDV